MVLHAAHAVARCTPLGVHEKRCFSFAHQNAPRSGDADKQAVPYRSVRSRVVIADDADVVDEQNAFMKSSFNNRFHY